VVTEPRALSLYSACNGAEPRPKRCRSSQLSPAINPTRATRRWVRQAHWNARTRGMKQNRLVTNHEAYHICACHWQPGSSPAQCPQLLGRGFCLYVAAVHSLYILRTRPACRAVRPARVSSRAAGPDARRPCAHCRSFTTGVASRGEAGRLGTSHQLASALVGRRRRPAVWRWRLEMNFDNEG
jgi:hypothetical protein